MAESGRKRDRETERESKKEDRKRLSENILECESVAKGELFNEEEFLNLMRLSL